MYTLYGSLGAASLTPQCVLEEASVPYELIEVDISEDTERDPEYLKLNPHGRIPTLVFDDTVIIESAAISIYLADKHLNTELSPRLDHPDRASYIQWMVYITNTLQETMTQKLYTYKYSDDPRCRDHVASRASSKLNMIISFLEESIGQTEGPFFLESGLSLQSQTYRKISGILMSNVTMPRCSSDLGLQKYLPPMATNLLSFQSNSVSRSRACYQFR